MEGKVTTPRIFLILKIKIGTFVTIPPYPRHLLLQAWPEPRLSPSSASLLIFEPTTLAGGYDSRLCTRAYKAKSLRERTAQVR